MRYTYNNTVFDTVQVYKFRLVLTTCFDKSVTTVFFCPFYWRKRVYYRVIANCFGQVRLNRPTEECEPPQIVIVNSRFLERPQKRSRRNQLIHRRLTKTKSIGSGQDPESQADSETPMVDGVWS